MLKLLVLAHLFVKRVSAQDVDVEVMDALSSVFSLVGHKSKTIFKAKVGGDFAHLFKALAKGDGVFFSHLGDVSIVLLGDEQKMDGGLRRNVLDDDHIVVFIKTGAWDFSSYNFTKKTVFHISPIHQVRQGKALWGRWFSMCFSRRFLNRLSRSFRCGRTRFRFRHRFQKAPSRACRFGR